MVSVLCCYSGGGGEGGEGGGTPPSDVTKKAITLAAQVTCGPAPRLRQHRGVPTAAGHSLPLPAPSQAVTEAADSTPTLEDALFGNLHQ